MNDRWPQLAFALFAAWLAVIVVVGPALADPTMAISSSHTFADYDQNRPGNELRVFYTAVNTSESGDINNMISFTIPAGSNQGVFAVIKPGGWVCTINSETTVCDGNGNVIPPGDFKVFKITSYITYIGQGEATAVAEGTLGNPDIPFNSVLVPVPAYHRLDRDRDVDIDGDDLVAFEACVSGVAIGFTGDCGWADLDGDTDVDQSDFGLFQRCLTGEGGGYIEGCEAE